jgi:hypothetical protein
MNEKTSRFTLKVGRDVYFECIFDRKVGNQKSEIAFWDSPFFM